MVCCQVLTCQGGVKLFVGRLPVEALAKVVALKTLIVLPSIAGLSQPLCDSSFLPDDNGSPLSCV